MAVDGILNIDSEAALAVGVAVGRVTMRCIDVEMPAILLDMFVENCLARERSKVLVGVVSLHPEIGSTWTCTDEFCQAMVCE